jgi:hypothetical protein
MLKSLASVVTVRSARRSSSLPSGSIVSANVHAVVPSSHCETKAAGLCRYCGMVDAYTWTQSSSEKRGRARGMPLV